MLHPQIAEAVCYAIPHRTLGEEVAALLVPVKGNSIRVRDVLDHARQYLARSKVPRSVRIVTEIPKSVTGKIVRRDLAQWHDNGPDRQKNEEPTGVLEEQLAEIWGRALRRQDIGRHDNFFMLGGDSLQAVEVFLEIEQEMGFRLPRSILFEAGSIAEIARLLKHNDHTGCVIPVQPEGARQPFFCVHGQDGGVIVFRELAELLGKNQPFYGIQSPSLDGASLAIDSMEELAKFYVDQIREVQAVGPYRLGGYSMGGRIALAMAARLQEIGEQVEILALLDTYSGVGHKNRRLAARISSNMQHFRSATSSGKTAYFRLKLKRLQTNLRHALSRPYRAAVLRWYRAGNGTAPQNSRLTTYINNRLNRRYRPQKYAGNTVLVRVDDQNLHTDVHAGWHKLLTGSFDVHTISGQHLTILEAPQVAHVAHKLSKYLCE